MTLRTRGRHRPVATPALAAEIVACRRRNMSYTQICQTLQVSRGTASRVVAESGMLLPARPPKERRPLVTDRADVRVVRKLRGYIGSTFGRYVDIALPRVAFLEQAHG